MSNRLSMVIVAALVSGAEMVLLFVLSAELAGGFAHAPVSWPALWILATAAFLLPAVLGCLPRPVYAVALGLVIAVSLLAIVYLEAFPGRSLTSLAWLQDAGRSLLGASTTAQVNVLLLLLIVLATWWRQLARDAPSSDSATDLFRYGPLPIVILLGVALLEWGAAGAELSTLAAYIVAFFCLSLLASSFTRWLENARRSSTRGGAVLTWLLTTLLPIAAAGGLVTLVSALLFGRALPVLRLALGAVLSVVAALAFVLGIIIGAVVWLFFTIAFALFPPHSPRPHPIVQPAQVARRFHQQPAHLQHLPEPVLWMLLVVVLLVALWALSRLRPRRDAYEGEALERESVETELGAGLRSLGRRLAGRLRARPSDPLQALLRDPTWRHTAEVRRAYREVETVYQQANLGRQPGQTPWEFAEVRSSRALTELTSVYQTARYNPTPASASDAERARQLAATIQSELKSAGP